MTDDKGAGEAYKQEYGDMEPDHPCVPDVWKNGFTAGRKSAEKDLKELLEMVDEFRSSIWWNGGLKFVKDFEDSLDSWKKARGIDRASDHVEAYDHAGLD